MRYGNGNAIVMVDDNPADILITRRCYRRSRLQNPWLEFDSPVAFLDYLERIARGDEPMPALVLLDINMPRLTGFDVLRHTRARSGFEGLPVFMMLSSSDREEEFVRARRLGADGGFTKPTDLSEYVRLFNGLVPSPSESLGGCAQA